MDIYTIGHSNHTWERFAELLRQHEVRVLVDTRTNPASKYAPFASARELPGLLAREDMGYVHLGESLGGKPRDPEQYDGKGKPDYGAIRESASFKRGIDDLLELAEESTVALMCAEEDPAKCHRRLLISPALEERGIRPRHIRADGSVQSSDRVGGKRAYQKQLQRSLPL